MIDCADLPTANMVSALKMNGSMVPMRIPGIT
jgi:hypothetical protein